MEMELSGLKIICFLVYCKPFFFVAIYFRIFIFRIFSLTAVIDYSIVMKSMTIRTFSRKFIFNL